MLKNYIKIAFRNLIRNRTHTLINVGGLTVGITCTILIFLVVQNEYSFDTWRPDSERIYRVVRDADGFGETSSTRGVPSALTDAVQNEVDGVEAVSIIDRNTPPVALSVELPDGSQRQIKEESVVFVQQSFFDIFSQQWVSGSPKTALERPNTVVITRLLAESLFGNECPFSQTISFYSFREYHFEVTGVIEDPFENTDFPLSFLASYNSLNLEEDRYGENNWSSFSTESEAFVKLREAVIPAAINDRLDTIVEKYHGAEAVGNIEYHLQPLSDIHFNPDYGIVNAGVTEKRYLLAIGLTGFFLLIAACINFINLNTALATRRSREVGLRKTMGSSRGQLRLYFLSETALVSFLSILLSLGLTELVKQQLQPFLGYVPDVNLWSNPAFFLFILGIFGLVTICAGWYPAQYLSGHNPVEAMKRHIGHSHGTGLNLRRSLTVAQFTITQVLIICVVIISKQMDFFQSQDMGFDSESVVEVQTPLSNLAEYELFNSLLEDQPGIVTMSFSNNGTISGDWSGNYSMDDGDTRHEGIGYIKIIEEEFVDTYGLTLLAGQNVVSSFTVEEYLVNETFAREVGYGDRYHELIGKTVDFWGNEAPIVGVVQDFNTHSLHNPIRPVVLTSSMDLSQVGIRIDLDQTSEALGAIEEAFVTTFPQHLFEYQFLDEAIASFYQREQRTAGLMNIFTGIAILIGCIGLFGLVSYMAESRTKEIGVRKILGASVSSILGLFSKEFVVLTGLAFVISTPIAWILMQRWLANFAYKVDMGPGVFLMAGGLALLIALLTVSWQSIRAALANPVDSLRSE